MKEDSMENEMTHNWERVRWELWAAETSKGIFAFDFDFLVFFTLFHWSHFSFIALRSVFPIFHSGA
jgi:hypothetical protein